MSERAPKAVELDEYDLVALYDLIEETHIRLCKINEWARDAWLEFEDARTEGSESGIQTAAFDRIKERLESVEYLAGSMKDVLDLYFHLRLETSAEIEMGKKAFELRHKKKP